MSIKQKDDLLKIYKKKDKYEKWIDEVNPIITDAEKAEVYSPLILRFFYLCRI